MRRVILSMYVSLDGVMEEPAWTMPYWNDEIAEFKFDELFASDALLLGRVTYQGFAQAWPSMTDEEGFADRMNSLSKYVASTTLEETEWNAQLITANVGEKVSKLKQQPGQDLLIYGSGDLVQTLMEHDLIDEYRLLVYPILLGRGKASLWRREQYDPETGRSKDIQFGRCVTSLPAREKRIVKGEIGFHMNQKSPNQSLEPTRLLLCQFSPGVKPRVVGGAEHGRPHGSDPPLGGPVGKRRPCITGTRGLPDEAIFVKHRCCLIVRRENGNCFDQVVY